MNTHFPPIVAKLDSGATRTYIRPADTACLHNIHHVQPTTIGLPDNSTSKCNQAGYIPLHHHLSKNAQTGYIVPNLKNTTLISAGQLCDDDCIVTFDKKQAYVHKHNNLVLTGKRNNTDGLWDIQLPSVKIPVSKPTPQPPIDRTTTTKQTINAIIRKDSTKKYLANYLYKCCFSPALTTFKKAIANGNFLTWPGLHEKTIQQYLTETPATAKGHLDQEQKSLQSTKSSSDHDSFPSSDTPNIKKHETHTTLLKHTAFCDPTGKYPYKSTRGNQYVFVTYDYDSNYIKVTPTKSRQAKELTMAWEEHHNTFAQAGIAPSHYIFDNEFSTNLKKALTKYNVTYEKVPPHIHRRNAAERAIRTFKNHFLAGLATVDPKFPIHEWDRLLQQAEITLNLLRNSRINPKLSAYAYINGNFNFNRNPLAPPGVKVAVHQKSTQRPSWGFHAEMGFYVGPAMEHYRCFTCYIPSTGTTRITDTVKFYPHDEPFPAVGVKDQFIQTISDLITILTNHNKQLPFLKFGDATKNAITTLSTLLQQNLQPTLPPPSLFKIKNPSKIPTSPDITPNIIEPDALVPRVKKQNCNSEPTAIFGLPIINHVYNKHTGVRETIDTLLQGDSRTIWSNALSNEWDRLADGKLNSVTPTHTIRFIKESEIPKGRKVTYGNFVCDIRPFKEEPNRVRLTVGGEKLEYSYDATSPASTLIETKLMLNSTISDAHKGAKFCSIDVKDFFLKTPMARPEYMKIKIKYFPPNIQKAYQLQNLVSADGYVYCRIGKGMYGLKQAARIAYDLLQKRLAQHGYTPCPQSINIWRHKSLPTKFCLCVDDFGIKYFSKSDAHHLRNALSQHYTITTDWTGSNFCGLTIEWNYAKKYVDISLPGYVNKVLQKFNHPLPHKPQYAPHKWSEPIDGKHIQSAIETDSNPILSKKETKYTQAITGSLLYYGRAIESPILPALNEIAHRQASPTKNTIEKCKMLLDYCATNPNGKIRFHASDMILHVDTDAAYLVLPQAKSRIAGYFYLSNLPSNFEKPHAKFNGAIHVECRTLKYVAASAAEAIPVACFTIAKLHCQSVKCSSISAIRNPEPLSKPIIPLPLIL